MCGIIQRGSNPTAQSHSQGLLHVTSTTYSKYNKWINYIEMNCKLTKETWQAWELSTLKSMKSDNSKYIDRTMKFDPCQLLVKPGNMKYDVSCNDNWHHQILNKSHR